MEMTGSYRMAAPRIRVWVALNDHSVLRDCIPGRENLDKLSDTEMQAVVSLKIAPVNSLVRLVLYMLSGQPPVRKEGPWPTSNSR
jgi:uncharacterized protein